MSETIGAAQVELGVDASGVDAGVARAKKTIAGLGSEAAKAGKAGSDGVAAIGKAGADSADKLDAATRRTIASIERQTLAMGKSRSEYYAAQAAIKGNTDALAPYISKLKEAEAANKKTADSQVSFAGGLSLARAALAGLGVSLSIGAFAAFAKSSIDAADRLDELSQITGTAVEQLAGLDYAAKQNGTSLETVARGGQKLSAMMADKPELFKKLGISATDSTEAMIQLADVFAGLPDGIQKSALATQLFGDKLGGEMVLFMNQGTESMRALIAEGRAYNPVTTESAARAAAFNDNLDKLRASAGQAGMEMTNSMLPQLAQISDAMAVAARESGLLSAMWVGLGGLGTALFTDDLLDRSAQIEKRIKSINDEIAAAEGMRGVATPISIPLRIEKGDLEAELQNIQQAAQKKLDEGNSEQSAQAIADRIKQQQALMEKVRSLLDESKKSTASDPNAKTLLGMEEAAFRKQMELLGVATEQVAVYELAMKGATKSQIDAAQASADQTIAINKQIAAARDAEKSQQDYMAALGKTTEELLAKAAAAESENARIGLTADQFAALTAARYDEQIALKTAEADRLRAIDGRENEAFLIDQQVVALKRLKDAEITRPQLEAQAREWDNFTRDIESSLTDALMRGFENGNGFGENFVDTLRNTLKTAPLKVMVQAIVQPVMDGVRGGGGSGSAGGASGGNWLTDFGGQTTNAAGVLGSKMYEVGMQDSGVWMMKNAETLGKAANAIGSGLNYLSAVDHAAAGEWGAGIGQGVGTYLLGPIGGKIGEAIGGGIDKLFGGGSGPKLTGYGGATIGYAASGDVAYRAPGALGAYSAEADSVIAQLQAQYRSTAGALGIQQGPTDWHFGNEKFADGSVNFRLAGGGFDTGKIAQTDAAVSDAAARAVFAALQSSELPDYLANVLDAVSASTASQADMAAAMDYALALKSVREQLTETGDPLQIAVSRIDELGAALNSTADTYTQDFIAAIDAGLSPDTLAQWQQFGALIEQTTQAEARLATEQHSLDIQLLEATGRSAEALAAKRQDELAAMDASLQATQLAIWAAQDKTAADLESARAAQTAAQAASQLASQRRSLDIQLMEATGRSTEALAAKRQDELAALDATLRPTMEAIWAAQDKAAADAESARVAQQAAQVQEQAAQQAAQAAQQMKNAWQSVTDSILGEVERIRGAAAATPSSYADATAAFYTATAQARAGDQEAAKRLASLSQGMISSYAPLATSSVDLDLVRGRAAASLQQTAEMLGGQYSLNLPSGGAISGGSGSGDLIAELRALRAENTKLREIMDARLSRIEQSTKETSDATNGNPRAPLLVEIA